jgi:histidine triad (HIT) family protein
MSDQPPAYDPDNIFAKIMRGEMPCHEVYSDDHTLAFLDIMPRVDGHTLVIPRAPSRNLLDAQPEDVARAVTTAQKIALAAKDAFEADGVALWQFSESAAGQIVFHLHFHIQPRHDGIELRPPGQMADHDVLADHAQRIRAALERLGS